MREFNVTVETRWSTTFTIEAENGPEARRNALALARVEGVAAAQVLVDATVVGMEEV